MYVPPELSMLLNKWVFASLALGLAFGFMIGRWYTLYNEPKKLRRDRARTLEALVALLTSTDKLSDDVGQHNSALEVAQKDISGVEGQGDLGVLQGRLLEGISQMVQSNRQLADELVVSRYQLDNQAQQLDKTKREARTDALCALGNRMAFDETMAFMASRRKSKGKSYALMLIDVDYFKRINDTFGHSAGDRVLISIGQSLVASVRPDDQVFRIGGDEFAVLLDGVTSETVTAVGSRIRRDVELREFHVGKGAASTVVTMSMGLTVAEPNDSPATLFVRADEALYYSKERGRNRLTTKTANRTEELTSESSAGLHADVNAKSDSSSYERFKAEMLKS